MFHFLSGASQWSDYAAVNRAVKRSVRPRLVIECQVPPHALTGGADAVIGLQIYVTLRHSRSRNTLSRQHPVPPIQIWMPWSFRSPVNSWLVN